jgi:hypothetical protein
MRCAGSIGWLLGISSSPAILEGSPYTSSDTDACRSASNDVRMPRGMRGSASVQCWSVWHMMASSAFGGIFLRVCLIGGRAGELDTT